MSDKELKERLKVCQECRYWILFMANQQSKMAAGACANAEDEMAPYGVVTAHFSRCEGFDKKPAVEIVRPPNSIIKK